MKLIRVTAGAAALAACFAIAGTTPACAVEGTASPAGVRPGPDGGPPDHDAGEASGPGGFGPGGAHIFGGHGPGAPGPDMPFVHLPLHGLQLTDVQQDKVFAIMHAQAPQQREHQKAIRKAHDALRNLARADKFDDARAAALARDLGQAIAADALLQARTQAQLLAVLTPEQRERLRQRRARGPGGRGPDGADDRSGRRERP